MSNEITKLVERVEKLEKHLKFTELLKGILLPLVLGILAFIVNSASNKISEAQFELAKAQQETQLAFAESQEQRNSYGAE